MVHRSNGSLYKWTRIEGGNRKFGRFEEPETQELKPLLGRRETIYSLKHLGLSHQASAKKKNFLPGSTMHARERELGILLSSHRKRLGYRFEGL
jgi:hypothetical protein